MFRLSSHRKASLRPSFIFRAWCIRREQLCDISNYCSTPTVSLWSYSRGVVRIRELLPALRSILQSWNLLPPSRRRLLSGCGSQGGSPVLRCPRVRCRGAGAGSCGRCGRWPPGAPGGEEEEGGCWRTARANVPRRPKCASMVGPLVRDRGHAPEHAQQEASTEVVRVRGLGAAMSYTSWIVVKFDSNSALIRL